MRGFKYPDLVSVAAERPFLPIRCFRNAAGTARGPGWEAAERGLHDVVPCRVVEGTDVFTVVSLSGTNDPVSASLMLKFVNRVKKLR